MYSERCITQLIPQASFEAAQDAQCCILTTWLLVHHTAHQSGRCFTEHCMESLWHQLYATAYVTCSWQETAARQANTLHVKKESCMFTTSNAGIDAQLILCWQQVAPFALLAERAEQGKVWTPILSQSRRHAHTHTWTCNRTQQCHVASATTRDPHTLTAHGNKK